MKTSIVLDTRRIKKDKTYPVKLRITFERKQKYYPTPFDLDSVTFEKIMFGKKLTEDEKTLKKGILAFENRATDIIKELNVISWQTFEKQYLTNRHKRDSIIEAYAQRISELKDKKNLGTAVMYECAQRSINKFMPEANFSNFQVDNLEKYEKWMLEQGRSPTTISMYTRTLKTLFNNEIEEGRISKELYPFGKKKYEVPYGKNIKKALTISDIEKIYKFKTTNKHINIKMRDYWLFLYLCNGINIKDMCLLKYSNIKGNFIEFGRAKTSRTKRNIEPIRVPLTDEILTIINKWGNRDVKDENYIFPILEKGLNAERERQVIQQITHVINDHMKKIAREIGITAPVTSYTARHSYATILQRNGVSVAFISEALGHSNINTTQNYLAGFEDDKKREVSSILTNFTN